MYLWGIIPFLVQWAKLTYYSSNHYSNDYNVLSITNGGSPIYQQSANLGGHYALLTTFSSLPEEEMENFLPQILNIIFDRDSLSDSRVIDQLEKAIYKKCLNSFPFGLRVCAALRAAAERPSEGFLRAFLSSSPIDYHRHDNLRRLREYYENATRLGDPASPKMISTLRRKYFSDYFSLLDWLAELGTLMKKYPREQRNARLKDALREGNKLLYYRMLSQGSLSDSMTSIREIQSYYDVSERTIAELCPAAASFSLHLPLQYGKDKVLRILRFVPEHCEILPSKDRCPFLVVVEVLERDFHCKEEELYTEGHRIIITPEDIEQGRTLYSKQIMPSMETYQLKFDDSGEDHSTSQEELSNNGLQIPIVEQQSSFDPHRQVDSPIENVRLFARPDVPMPTNSQKPMHLSSSSNVVEGLRGGQTTTTDLMYHPQQQYRHPAEADPRFDFNSLCPYPNNNEPFTESTFHHPNSNGRAVAVVQPQTWEQKKQQIKAESPFGHLPNWALRSFIVKSGDDLRKEVLAMQLIELCQRIFEKAGLDVFLRPYQILPTGQQSGLVEFLEGALSIDRIKKLKPDRSVTLSDYFAMCYGDPYNFMYTRAVQNFVKSLVGYSLFTYIAQVKDRHNANLLVDQEGHIVHIDFGFILGDSPGFNMNYESAPFKLPKEYVDLMGGPDSQMFMLFQDLFLRGFNLLQGHVDELATIIHLFYGDRRRADAMRARLLCMKSQDDILGLIRESYDNARTKSYDWFQHQTNNISK